MTPNTAAAQPADSDQWFTPQVLVDALARRLDLTFTLDPAATAESAKAPTFFTAADDGLAHDWTVAAGDGAVWLNPPYSNPGPWVAKAARTASRGTPVVALLRASTDTTWWHDHVMTRATGVTLLRGRVRYVRPGGKTPGPANHASALVVWLPSRSGPPSFDSVPVAELCQPPATTQRDEAVPSLAA